jgi:hypothetical protein
MKNLSCPNKHRPPSGKEDAGTVIRHGFCRTRWGKHRRYCCQTCGKTFSSGTGTPYYRLQYRHSTFDSKASTSPPSLESSGSPGTQFIAGGKGSRIVPAVQQPKNKRTLHKFGQQVRTPAQQAGLTERALTLREIFSSRLPFVVVSRNVIFALYNSARPVSFHIRGVRLAA